MTTIHCPVTNDDMVDVLSTIDPALLDQKCLDHGFVRVVDVMPRLVPAPVNKVDGGVTQPNCDFSIADAARISYQKGTRKVNADSSLVDHLVRNQHTSPVEMGELKLHIRLPIFVMRQHVRHRTASLNEESARYSELAADFYIPDRKDWAINTTANKQATVKATLSRREEDILHEWIKSHNDKSYDLYQQLLKGDSDEGVWEIPGISREQARMVLGVNIYTQCIWKIDLKNLLHYLKLRTDPHAQYEIRVFADAIGKIVEALFPATYKSFKDNFIDGVNFSATELKFLKELPKEIIRKPDEWMKEMGWSSSRFKEFSKKAQRSGLISKSTLDSFEEQAYPTKVTP